ncbi:MAG: hypothetical protein ACFFDL_17710 [Promethearchaeota archaeon]
MIMYEDEYKHSKSGKEGKEKDDTSDIYQEKSQEVKKFAPSLEKTDQDKKRAFTPSLTPEPKQKRANFSPSMEPPKESKQKRFTLTLTIDPNKKRRNFTPSLEMSEKKERKFFPTLNLTDDKKLHEKQEDIYNTEMINKIFNHISELTPKFIEYMQFAKKRGKENVPNLYPNRGIRITDKFKNWIKTNEIDPFKAKQYLSQIEQVNNYKYIQEIVKHKITTTNDSLKEIARSLKVYGLNISPHKIKEIALKQLYNNNQNQMNNRFPPGTGGFLNEVYSLDKNRIIFENIKLLQEKFIQYHEYAEKNNLKNKYANRGAKVTNLFINWISENEKNLETRKNLIEAAKKITKNGEIPQYIMEKTINSELSMRAISAELKKKGIYLSHHAIGNYARDHVLENKKAKVERFPSSSEIITEQEENKIANYLVKEIKQGTIKSIRKVAKKFGRSRTAIIRIAEDTLKKSELDNIWIANKDIIPEEKIDAIKNEVKKYYPKSIKKLKETFAVSEKAISRIAKEENSKEEYERKWPVHEKIPIITRNAVINNIKNSILNQAEIADKYSITRHSVRRFAKDQVFGDDVKGFRDRFPKEDFLELGTETHNCVLDEVTLYFNTHYKELFFAEPKIFPNSRKGVDGLILNDQKFLQKRLIDPNNTDDLSLLIHHIPAKSLNTQFDHIKAIQFDLTNDITYDNVIKKCLKYQRPDLMLYIVGTHWYPYDPVKPLPNDKNILYPQNIRVINHELFSDLIGFQGKAKEHFEQIVDLNYNTDIGTLKKIHELNNIKWNDTDQLREILKEKKLIKNSINEYFKIRPKSKYIQKKLF